MYGYIYKIVNSVNSKIYVGSTIGPLEYRFKQHLREAKTHPNRKFYIEVNNLGPDKFNVEIIECVKGDIDTIRLKEYHCIEQLKPELNTSTIYHTKDLQCEYCGIKCCQSSFSKHTESKKHKKNENKFYLDLLPINLCDF